MVTGGYYWQLKRTVLPFFTNCLYLLPVKPGPNLLKLGVLSVCSYLFIRRGGGGIRVRTRILFFCKLKKFSLTTQTKSRLHNIVFGKAVDVGI